MLHLTMPITSIVTTKGQVVIPKEYRDKLNIIPSTQVVFDLQEDKLILKPILTVEKMEGIAANKNAHPPSPQKQKALIKKAILQKNRQKHL